MAETIFSIQELCDHLAGHIASHPDQTSHCDLKSAALVCQTLCISAQAQLFRHVIITPLQFLSKRNAADAALSNSPATSSVFAARRTPALAAAAAHRLSAVLAGSPHLARYIRQLDVFADPPIVKSVSMIQLPALQKIRVWFNPREPAAEALHFARDLIGLPSIRDVELIDLALPVDLPFELFTSLFDTCTRHLESLTFTHVALPSGPSALSVSLLGEKRKTRADNEAETEILG
ncbi:hypothetical protein DFH09DRAFT_392936 [Mycena vulgaris]|nr:hypothetical protein DFH09DRAFT_392936 [Mycena vulgaris]